MHHLGEFPLATLWCQPERWHIQQDSMEGLLKGVTGKIRRVKEQRWGSTRASQRPQGARGQSHPEGRAKRKSVHLSHFLPVQPCGREQPEPRKGQRTRGRVIWTAASTPAGREPQAAGSWRRGLAEVAASRRPALKHQGTSHPGPSVVTIAAPKDLQQMVCNSDEQELLTS